MADKDLAVGVATLPPVGSLNKKPIYLICLEPEGKSKTSVKFIANDKPELLQGFICVKGIYVDSLLTEDEIAKNYLEILTNASKESILEMLFPWHQIISIRSLIFRSK